MPDFSKSGILFFKESYHIHAIDSFDNAYLTNEAEIWSVTQIFWDISSDNHLLSQFLPVNGVYQFLEE